MLLTEQQEYRKYIIINIPYAVLHILLENGVLKEYLNYATSVETMQCLGTDLRRLTNDPSNNIFWIHWAFNWYATEEGTPFWKYISDQVLNTY